jgi:signal transduction histidine kinase/ActR/RegA family two-component response regulator
MISFFQQLFDTAGFPPRWTCGDWTEAHGWLHILSDLAITGAYFAIPLTLVYFVRRRTDLPFVPIFWLFAAFIVSCGTTHLVEASIFWHPWYRFSGLMKMITAVVSWMTVIALIMIIPNALALPGVAKLNLQLTDEIAERKQVEEALRASEARMRLATEATEVGIWEWNILTGVVHWDDQMFRLYGIEPTADGHVTYDTWSRAVLPEDLPEQEDILKNAVLRLEKSTLEFRIVRADNMECRWIHAVQIVRKNDNGAAEWLIGTNLDVTAQKSAERTIREEAQRKDEFLAMLGHELRNPLNAIRSAVQLSHAAPDDQGISQWASQVIDRQSQQLSRMVDDLLDVARINRGRIELRTQALDLGPVLEQAISVVQPHLAQRRQTFTSDIGTQMRVTGDAPRLQQVFVNLLTNAVKYTPEDGRISLRTRIEDGQVVVAISDNGVGISPELLPHVFDLFRQAESTLDRSLGGLGIGLSVVKSLVERHNGSVIIESPGKNAGTTVTVRLPLLIGQPAAQPPAEEHAPEPARSEPLRVLIVDDHKDAAETLQLLLNLHGFETRCAHSGPAGVEAARQFRPQVLLLDIGLPGFDGFEVVRILRAEAAFTHAIFVAISGYAQEEDRRRCLASGFDHQISKPFDLSELIETIRSGKSA